MSASSPHSEATTLTPIQLSVSGAPRGPPSPLLGSSWETVGAWQREQSRELNISSKQTCIGLQLSLREAEGRQSTAEVTLRSREAPRGLPLPKTRQGVQLLLGAALRLLRPQVPAPSCCHRGFARAASPRPFLPNSPSVFLQVLGLASPLSRSLP